MGAAVQRNRERLSQELAKRDYRLSDEDGSVEGLKCGDCGEARLYLDDEGARLACAGCGVRVPALEFVMAQGPRVPKPARDTGAAVQAGQTGIRQAGWAGMQGTASEQPDTPRPAEPTRRGSLGEHLIIATLALLFLVAGLMAAAMSGFANYQAFGAMVDDPLQSRVWAWTGVIASVCSFGGFTFVYWHWAAGRWREGLRAVVFALAGAATSLVGTQMYMANTELARAAEADAAIARRPVLEAQIADWRTQLAAIPGEVRTVEGLEAYLAEVERVGRTHQKPYRDAQIELGLAKRRDELEAKIETASAELMGLGDGPTVNAPPPRQAVPSWFFAAMLEVFSSQGTSIGFVALLILTGRRPAGRDDEPAT